MDIKGQLADLIVTDEPVEEKSRVERSFGQCVVCEVYHELIHAFDSRVYKGGACPDCLLERTRELTSLELGSRIMAPMVFVAKALRGEEPFTSLLRAAESQDPEKLEETLKASGGDPAELARARELRRLEESRSILKRQGLLTFKGKPNRKQRRAAEAEARREARWARKAAKRRAKGKGTTKKRKS